MPAPLRRGSGAFTLGHDTIIMNFIIKLPSLKDPMTKVEYDNILVIMD
jgi:hypothetical protein